MEQKKILIADTEFLIDTVNEQLVQKDNETNIIKFRAMEDMASTMNLTTTQFSKVFISLLMIHQVLSGYRFPGLTNKI